VYSREIDGQNLTFASVGILYEDTFVLFDEETESLWYHLEGHRHDRHLGRVCRHAFGGVALWLHDLERVEGAAP
jgi:hypothetical protein